MCKFYFNRLQNEKTGPRIVKPIRGGGGAGAGNVTAGLSHKKPAVSTTHNTAAAAPVQSKSVTKPAGTRADVI